LPSPQLSCRVDKAENGVTFCGALRPLALSLSLSAITFEVAIVFYVFLLLVAALGVGVYLLFIFNLVPGAREERLGVLEPLPEDVGKWKLDEHSVEGKTALEAGRKREERLFFEEGAGVMAQGRLLRQVRFRNAVSNAIEEVLPDQPVKRKRIRS
jgi:hypothetical protein